MAADYFGPGAAAGPYIEALTNRKIGGGDITRKEGFEGAKERLAYVFRAQRPKLFDPAIDIYRAASGTTGNYGQETSLTDPALKMMAIRARTVDVSKQLPFTLAIFNARWRQAASVESIGEKRYQGKPDKIASEKKYADEKRAELKRLYQQAIKDYRTLGVSSHQISAMETKAKVPNALKGTAIDYRVREMMQAAENP